MSCAKKITACLHRLPPLPSLPNKGLSQSVWDTTSTEQNITTTNGGVPYCWKITYACSPSNKSSINQFCSISRYASLLTLVPSKKKGPYTASSLWRRTRLP